MRQGLGQIWGGMAEGWRQLQSRAAQALTHFTPTRRQDGVETMEDQAQQHASRWGLLAAEIMEGKDAVVVRLEAPGMDRDAFDIQMVNDKTLLVSGEKRMQRREQHGEYRVMECAYGRFQRLLSLPAKVSEAGASAVYRQGVLTITLPKHPVHSRRLIPVGPA